MAVRERDEAWEKYHQSLKWQIARRDADYLELHREYMALQLEHQRALKWAMRLHSERARAMNEEWWRERANAQAKAIDG